MNDLRAEVDKISLDMKECRQLLDAMWIDELPKADENADGTVIVEVSYHLKLHCAYFIQMPASKHLLRGGTQLEICLFGGGQFISDIRKQSFAIVLVAKNRL